MEDILMEHHRQRTKSSLHEAFMDEVYASPITKFESHLSHSMRHVGLVLTPIFFGVVIGFILSTLFIARG